jgi:hypothetical protein
MDKKDKLKETIKKDLLKNIDKVVNDIYKSLNNSSFSAKLDDTQFIIDGDPYKELSISDKLTGKEICPHSNKSSDPEEIYVEVNMDEISKKIRLSEQIFTHEYKFTYKNGMKRKDIPACILNIFEVYEIHINYQKTKNLDFRSTSKWLFGLLMFGNIRLQNKTNSPYITKKEIKKIVKAILRNIKYIYNVLNGKYILIDPDDRGIPLFDHNFDVKHIKLEKIE